MFDYPLCIECESMYALSLQHLCFCKVTNYEFNVRNEKKLVPHLALGEFTFIPW